jgi:hypothetical protein
MNWTGSDYFFAAILIGALVLGLAGIVRGTRPGQSGGMQSHKCNPAIILAG